MLRFSRCMVVRLRPGKRRLNDATCVLQRPQWSQLGLYNEQHRLLSTQPKTNEPMRQSANDDAQQPVRAAKERQRKHEERVVAARRAKVEEKRMNMRRNAARAIPYWLGNDPECFDRTMKELNLTSPRDKEAQDGILLEYKHLYLDSIPSFFQNLTSSKRLDPQMRGALDQLVDAGFADLLWAKNHRKMKEYQANYEMYAKQIKRKARQQQDRQKKATTLRETLQELEGDMTDKEEKEKEEDDEKEPNQQEGLFSNVMRIVQKWMGTTDDSAALEATQFLSEKERKIEKTRRLLKKAEESVVDAERHLLTLKSQRDSFQPMLTRKEYEKANKVVSQVLDYICQELAGHIHNRHARMIERYRTLDAQTDMTKPHEWYMYARLDQRKIIFHGGPTNSGKTFNALERLKTAKKGLYLGPLRLLAAEVYEKLTSEGIYTNLLTGQEKREIPFATHSAATVELAPTNEEFDIVVIDEIQMIADPFRGFSWTRALMGLRCKEIHVCGGLEAKSIVEKIAHDCGDQFDCQTYDRFSELEIAERSIASKPNTPGSYRHVRPGDCVVAFSRSDIFAIKREIEKSTKYKCCVIYGSLPPETRTDQARRFNDPDSGYDVLVASDAIGMGLNLNIRRIIFNSMFKSNGETIVQLDHSAVKQIAGRAGRRNSPYPNGEVTCRDPQDMPYMRQCMATEIPTIQKAGLLPTAEHIGVFSQALRNYALDKDYDDLNKVLKQFSDMATLKGDYFLCRQTPMRVIAKWLNDLNLSISDKYTLCMAPIPTHSEAAMTTLRKFAKKHAVGEASGLNRNMIPRTPKSFDDLSRLCSIHNELELFMWLHNRFPGNVVEQQTAMALKERAISLINLGLGETDQLALSHCYIKRDGRLREMWKRNQSDLLPDLEDYLSRSNLTDI